MPVHVEIAKRVLVGLLLGACALAAQAQAFPAPGKPIRILVGFAAGGGADVQARLVAAGLAETLGTPVVVVNRPGASTMLAAHEVARAAPDGYTMLYSISGAFAQVPHTLASVPYDPFRDFTPISLGALGPSVLVAHESVPANNVRELVAYAKADPGKLNYASFGIGTSSYLFAEILMRQYGIDITHIPYTGGGQLFKDLLAGRVQLLFDAAPTAIQNAKTGKVKMLGVAAEVRSPLLPGVPTLSEQGVRGIDIIGWLGFFGPAGMPPDVVRQLNAALGKVLGSRQVREGFSNGGYEAVASSPGEFAAMVKDSYERWGAVVRELGLKPQ